MNKILRILGNILVIYGLILFVLTAYYDGQQFGEDVSIINYIIRFFFGFAPAAPFILPGVILITRASEDIINYNFIEDKLFLYIDDFSFLSILGKLFLASIYLHLGMIGLKIIMWILEAAYSVLSFLFSIFS